MLYNKFDNSKKLCYRCLNFDTPKVKKGKDKWYKHYFVCCKKCGCKVFFS